MVNFNPVSLGYDCQMTIGPSKDKRKQTPCFDKRYHTNKRKERKGEEIEILRNRALMTRTFDIVH